MISSVSTQSSLNLRVDREKCEGLEIRQPLNERMDLVLVQIPEGDCMMGSPEDEEGRRDSEEPQHRVYVQEFWMGQYPVTQEEWRIVVDYNRVNRDLNPNPSHFKGDRLPVENVSWDDAVEFCDRLSQHTGLNYRLPTEAEWEYACRAGTTTPFHFGETITTEFANYRGTDDDYGRSGSYGGGPKGDYRGGTTSVGVFDVTNRFGLADMHGNVWEWCQDHWHENYKGAPTDGSAWMENTPQSNHKDRLFRGGSWANRPWDCRSAYRNHIAPEIHTDDLGFRVVLTPQ